MRPLLILLALLGAPISASADTLDTSLGSLTVTPVLTGLDEPWGLDFLPEGGFLVTERDGQLRHATASGKLIRVSGLPEIATPGQGGLLDVAVAKDFATSREIFLTYAKRQGGGSGTALAVAQLSTEGDRLENLRQLFEMREGSSGGRHFGSRIVETPDGKLFVTLGERGDEPAAQDRSRHNGSIIRINRDGSVPGDNPFVNTEGALPEIWSWGHRNPQGAALDLQGRLWVNEHGAMGGDEVNRIEKGANYGWPAISYGLNYDGSRIGQGTTASGMEQPAYYWDPSIAPSGLMVYSGKLWPEWKGDFFSGSLKFDYISRLDPDNGWSEERITSDATQRVRDVVEGPDGTIWFLSVGQGAVYRITPG